MWGKPVGPVGERPEGISCFGARRVERIGCTQVGADLALSETDQPPLLPGVAFPNSLISMDTSKVANLSKDKTAPIFFLFLIQLREMSTAVSD